MNVSVVEQDLREALVQGDVHEGFVIDTLDKASWAMRKIAWAEAKIAEIHKAADAERDAITAWERDAESEFQRTIEIMSALLRPYAENQVHESGKKSLKLPKGTAGFRAQPPTYHRQDDVLIEWARPMGFIRVKEEVDWSNLKAFCTVTNDKMITPEGEIVPGVQVETQPDKFYVKVEGK